MSNDEFETWLSLVGRLLQLNDRQRGQIGEELRDHLESRVAELLESGMDERSAALQAVEEFGDAAVLAKNLQSVSLVNRKRWMMRFTVLASAAMFLAVLLTMAMWPDNARFGAPATSVAQDDAAAATQPASAVEPSQPSETARANAEVRKQLNQKLDMDFKQVPFSQVADFIREQTGCNVMIDPMLEGEFDGDSLVSCQLRGVKLSDSLHSMLRRVDATYLVRYGFIEIISTADEGTPDYLTRQMIDVSGLLKLIENREVTRLGRPAASDGDRVGMSASTGMPVPQPVVDPQPVQQSKIGLGANAEAQLIETTKRVVSPDNWVDNGGSSDLTCIGGVLVVTASESLVSEVKDFVKDLEHQMTLQAK